MNGVAPDGGLLEHLQAEHHKLNCTLSAIQHRLNELSAAKALEQSSYDMVAALQALKAELVTHVAEEGTDGCLGEAATRCPSVAAQLNDIAADDKELLRSVNELIDLVTDKVGDPAELSRQFGNLAERLHAHELAETRLLQYALGGDVADYDVEGDD